MFSAKPMAVVVMLALAGAAVAQEEADEQRIAELIEALKDEERREQATFDLITIGAPSAEALMRAIRQGGDGELEALAVLGEMGPPGADLSILEFLVDYHNNSRGENKLIALHALGTLVPFGGKAWEEAQRSLVSGWVAPGQWSWSEIDHLEYEMLMNRAYVRAHTADRLGTDEEILQCLRANLVHQREVAAEALFHRRAPGFVPTLVEALEKGESYGTRPPALRSADGRTFHFSDDLLDTASRILVWLAPEDPQIARAYAYRLTHHSVGLMRRQAARALGEFGSGSEEFVADLLKATQDSPPVAREAVTALGMIGPAAKDAIPVLEKLAEHEDRQTSERAKAALRQIRKDGQRP